MAKKKPVKEEVEVDDLEDEFLEEETVEETAPVSSEEDDLDAEEEEEFEIEEEPRFLDYKFLKLGLKRVLQEGDYELNVEGQSHGFCNILVKHLLKTEGVKAAAYKVTGIEPPQIFIRLEQDKPYKIQDILFEAIESLRGEVIEAQKLFEKLV
ncbi:MAG: RpoL/Rpb11 RNA polymerase subunit family protein [Promethearchaeota archaeon]|jgi:DNA-directed RNA polymerase subunit L